MKYFKYLSVFLSSLLMISCIGEDIETSGLSLNIENEKLFSISIDENDNNILQLRTSLDDSENLSVLWSSLDPKVIDVDSSGKIILSTDENQLGKSASLLARAYDNSSISNGQVIEGQTFVVESQRDIVLGKITVRSSDVLGVGKDQQKEIAKFGFEEKLEKTKSLASIDVADQMQQLAVSFTNFRKEVVDNPQIVWTSLNENILAVDQEGKLSPKVISETPVKITATVSSDLTSRGEPLLQEFLITVGNQTEEEVIPEPEPEPESQRTLVGSGSFTGRNNYTTVGGFSIYRESSGIITLELSDNFSTGGITTGLYVTSGSVPFIGIQAVSVNTPNRATLINNNISKIGAQSFTLDIDITGFDSVYINCEDINRATGTGNITFN